jgi:inhibitor of cysteine peptidase
MAHGGQYRRNRSLPEGTKVIRYRPVMHPRLRSRLLPLLVVGLLVVGLAACDGDGGSEGSGGSGGSGGSRDSAPAVYTAGDSITVAKGDTFVIELESNPTTGYSWTAEPNPDVEFVKSAQVTNSTLVGAPGMQQLTFRAVATGSSTLVLDYERSFEPDQPPAQTERFPLTVE